MVAQPGRDADTSDKVGAREGELESGGEFERVVGVEANGIGGGGRDWGGGDGV